MVAAAPAFNPAQVTLLADAVLAGLSFDLQEAPATWQTAPQVVPERKHSAPVSTQASPAVVRPAAPVSVAPPQASPAPLPAWQLWQAGTPGGILVVLTGEAPPSAEAHDLLKNMLKAVGLASLPVALVGLAGSPNKTQQPEVKEAIAAAATAATPTHTLVLGQGVLGTLLGKLQGVEGWQAAPSNLGLPGQVGVTFPLELLLAKPLFKSLAWQHLQAWHKRWNEGK